MQRYEINILWSNEDEAFVADVPELPGCRADGNSQGEALDNAREAIELWVDTAREFGDPVPTQGPQANVFLIQAPSGEKPAGVCNDRSISVYSRQERVIRTDWQILRQARNPCFSVDYSDRIRNSG